ncbi:TetR/AcrR family transcriptional regulator, partial [Mesorhizobium sp. M1E.F.Ca.ET.041.01.1.1]
MEGKVAGITDQAAIASPRRAPTQQRSRERVERMLSA